MKTKSRHEVYMRVTRSIFVPLLIMITLCIYPTFTRAQDSIYDILDSLGSYDCPDSDYTCVTLTVPLDHFSAEDTRTIEVVFGILPASGERKGMLVTATGGPGSSGLASADAYYNDYDYAVTDLYDLVFFDQRGAKQSGDLQCPDAIDLYYSADWYAATPNQENALVETARTFANDCVDEMGVPADTLQFYSTRQAVEDLELFRQAIGDDKIWLAGESYGTEYVQHYAAAHPDRVAALMLDGTVDLTISLLDFAREQTQSFNDVLVETLNTCTNDNACSADAGGDALALYDDLIAELGVLGNSFEFPLASGGTDERRFYRESLESIASSYLYSESGRLLFQRSLAAASRGSLIPLARLGYLDQQIDPETYRGRRGDDFSSTLYFVVSCSDYRIAAGTPEAQAETYLRAGDVVEETIPRLSYGFYDLLPCAFWPGNAPEERPAPLVAEGIPTFVLGATADPATPVENGERVYSQLADGYLITTNGGAHVIFNRGDACPDNILNDFLVDGTRPEEREISCEGVVADAYVPLAAADASTYENPLQALHAAYNEIYYLPDYYYWDQNQLVLAACPYGGSLAFAPDSTYGEQFRLSECAFSDGFKMTGTGTYDYDTFTLDVEVGGLEEGNLLYTLDSDGNISVTGEYAGETVDLSDTSDGTAA
jgi:pimeloyl-ACP methyl ester carboxylesterase